jgi:hypothetical protein
MGGGRWPTSHSGRFNLGEIRRCPLDKWLDVLRAGLGVVEEEKRLGPSRELNPDSLVPIMTDISRLPNVFSITFRTELLNK